ncbi:hypothetical protein [Pseudanabaena minima]|uniref:hypothetical protein n=1 Tax=Pseudanabaena minima TaxID=890415 RepID=UPI003DA87257
MTLPRLAIATNLFGYLFIRKMTSFFTGIRSQNFFSRKQSEVISFFKILGIMVK